MKVSKGMIKLLEDFLGYDYNTKPQRIEFDSDTTAPVSCEFSEFFKSESNKGINNSGGKIMQTQLEYDGASLNHN